MSVITAPTRTPSDAKKPLARRGVFMLVVEDLRVHHPGMTVDRVMQIPVAPAGVRTFPSGRVTGPAGRPVLVRAPAEHPPYGKACGEADGRAGLPSRVRRFRRFSTPDTP